MSSQPAEVPIPVERPTLEARIATIGAYLLSAGTVFFFVAFLFAFFYLRALNSNNWWAGPNGKQVSVPTGSGIAILVCVLVSVVLMRLALHDLRGSRRGSWWPLGLAALLLGLAAVAIQCWQYTDLAFGTEEGGYASVYLGWTGAFTLFAFGAMIWLEMLLATARRASTPPITEETSVASFSIFWTTLGVVQVFAFILLFGVK